MSPRARWATLAGSLERHPLQEGVHRCGHAVKGTQEDDLTVQELHLDRPRARARLCQLDPPLHAPDVVLRSWR